MLSIDLNVQKGTAFSFKMPYFWAKVSKMSSKEFEFLGSSVNEPPASPAEAQIETFENRHKKRSYLVSFECGDFTSRCPVTQQSDFANVTIQYIPSEKCIETKSLKYYLQAYREEKMFNEDIVNNILNDLVEACAPKWMIVEGAFASRGGISLTTVAEYPNLDHEIVENE